MHFISVAIILRIPRTFSWWFMMSACYSGKTRPVRVSSDPGSDHHQPWEQEVITYLLALFSHYWNRSLFTFFSFIFSFLNHFFSLLILKTWFHTDLQKTSWSQPLGDVPSHGPAITGLVCVDPRGSLTFNSAPLTCFTLLPLWPPLHLSTIPPLEAKGLFLTGETGWFRLGSKTSPVYFSICWESLAAKVEWDSISRL